MALEKGSSYCHYENNTMNSTPVKNKMVTKDRNLQQHTLHLYLNEGALLLKKCSYSLLGIFWVERVKVHMQILPFT